MVSRERERESSWLPAPSACAVMQVFSTQIHHKQRRYINIYLYIYFSVFNLYHTRACRNAPISLEDDKWQTFSEHRVGERETNRQRNKAVQNVVFLLLFFKFYNWLKQRTSQKVLNNYSWLILLSPTGNFMFFVLLFSLLTFILFYFFTFCF